MKKVFGYLRVSGRGQVDGDGFPRQLAAVRAFALANDLRLIRIFREEGIAGTAESFERPAFAEMLSSLYSDGVRTVIVERLDRLARDLMVQERIVAEFQKNGFELISVAEPDLMATDPQRVFFRQIMGAVAQLDKGNIVAKLRGARLRKKATEGRCEGAKPYGFYEGEDSILERMKALRHQGMGFDRIAVALNAEGLKPRRGVRWYGIGINKILMRTGAASVVAPRRMALLL